MADRASIITPQQCKRARAMLKWNPQDLASRTRIHVRVIEKFERNQARLHKPENAEIIDAFGKQNIVFFTDGEVIMEYNNSDAVHGGQYERISLDEANNPSDLHQPVTQSEAQAVATARPTTPGEQKVVRGTSPQTSE